MYSNCRFLVAGR